jgi:hypothetical protein
MAETLAVGSPSKPPFPTTLEHADELRRSAAKSSFIWCSHTPREARRGKNLAIPFRRAAREMAASSSLPSSIDYIDQLEII